ncbi:MAG: chromosomal replication initiator protein DnaA [Desulfobacterota bacterium]|nr:chromosomal replication initiator protein DnaA [Thermodesulfobacteriota bacterium]
MKEFWNQCLSHLSQRLSEKTVETWFKPIHIIDLTSSSIRFGVPKQFYADWIKENYFEALKETLAELLGKTPHIVFSIIGTPEPQHIVEHEKQHDKKIALPKNINPLYTFANFVVGPGNQFAHAASRAVADRPGGTYNPLFIYGGVGLGKTHLLHAIVNECFLKYPQIKICYVTSEKFTNELINSIRNEKMPEFRNKYRNIDVLLLDDIQFLAGKERTQEEFFHTFNALFEVKKQIVVTSDKTPREIKDLEERVRNRFEWGLIADIQPPDIETKVAILKQKALVQKIHLPNDVAFLLANSVQSNIRELEGLLTRLTAYSSLYGHDITLDFTKEVLKDFLKIEEKDVSPEEIIKHIARFFNIRAADIKGKKKNASIVLPRQIAMYIMRKRTNLSLPEIGQHFSGRDHSTVIYSLNKIEQMVQEDKKIKDIVESILNKL